jgi:hypothetical protein
MQKSKGRVYKISLNLDKFMNFKLQEETPEEETPELEEEEGSEEF